MRDELRLMKKLPEHPLFSEFSKEELQTLIGLLRLTSQEYMNGDIIFEQGKPKPAVCCLLAGEVEASIYQRVNRGYRRTVINWFSAPAVFGEAFAFAGRGTQIEVAARKKSRVCFIPGDVLMEAYEHPLAARLSAGLVHHMWEKMGILKKKVFCLQGTEVRERLLLYLSTLETGADGCFFIPYPESALAAYLGYTRAALHTAFGELAEEGTLELSNRRGRLLKSPDLLGRLRPADELPGVKKLMEYLDVGEIRRLEEEGARPENAKRQIQALCRMSIAIEEMNLNIMLQQTASVHVKILKFLLDAGKNADGTLTAPVSVNELAAYLGVQRQTISAELTLLQKQGVIVKKGGGESIRVCLPEERLLEEIISEVRGPKARELAPGEFSETDVTENK